MLKSPAELRKLDASSEDIFLKGSIDRYAERPQALEHLCLADFIACYSYKGKGYQAANIDEQDDPDGHTIDEPTNDDVPLANKIKLNDGILTLRKIPKVIRFCSFSFQKDPVNFFRERIMLFLPWRNELEEVENVNGENTYKQHREIIEANSKKYIELDLDISALLQEIDQQRAAEDENENWDAEIDPDFINVFDYDDNILQPNAMFDIGEEQTPSFNENKKFTVPDQLSNDEYLQLCDTLNDKQRDYLMHIISSFKSNELPVYHFISGGAGVGKSRLIQAIYQSLIRIFRKDPGSAESLEILIVALTGKAAHVANGMTAHTAFKLPLVEGNSESFKGLSPEVLNTMRVKLSKLQLLIIDEVSMMGVTTFERIHQRLNQVFGLRPNDKRIFGGVSVIVLGDFNQVRLYYGINSVEFN